MVCVPMCLSELFHQAMKRDQISPGCTCSSGLVAVAADSVVVLVARESGAGQLTEDLSAVHKSEHLRHRRVVVLREGCIDRAAESRGCEYQRGGDVEQGVNSFFVVLLESHVDPAVVLMLCTGSELRCSDLDQSCCCRKIVPRADSECPCFQSNT